MSVLGVAVIGAGDMGSRHAQHWRAVGARVVGIFDADAARAERLALTAHGQAFTGIEELLASDEVQVVSVCTPTFLHARYTVPALEAGKHVLCEKPAALTLPDALVMKEAERASGRQLRIGFMRRFDPACQQLMDFRRKIGDPLLAQATIAAGIRPKHLMHDAAANGGPIIDMCCHIFDQWAALYGERPTSVRAYGYTFGNDKIELVDVQHKALDSAHITLTYPGGGVGQVHVSWGLPSGIEPLEHHTYMAPKGLITVDWPRQVTLRNTEGTTRWKSRGVDPWQVEISRFHEELLDGKRRHLATIDDGIEALRTSLAVLESAAQDRDIDPQEISGEMPETKEPA